MNLRANFDSQAEGLQRADEFSRQRRRWDYPIAAHKRERGSMAGTLVDSRVR
jgi:hypothetical protein